MAFISQNMNIVSVLDKIIAQEDYIFGSCSRMLYPTNLFDKENNDFY